MAPWFADWGAPAAAVSGDSTSDPAGWAASSGGNCWQDACCLHTCSMCGLLEQTPDWVQGNLMAPGAELDRMGQAFDSDADSAGPGSSAAVAGAVDNPTAGSTATVVDGGECCCLWVEHSSPDG
jgi:hypothetical protein